MQLQEHADRLKVRLPERPNHKLRDREDIKRHAIVGNKCMG